MKVGNDNNKKDPLNSKYNDTKIEIEDPYFVSGFADAESCFNIRIRKNKKCKIGWEVMPCLHIHLQAKDWTYCIF